MAVAVYALWYFVGTLESESNWAEIQFPLNGSSVAEKRASSGIPLKPTKEGLVTERVQKKLIVRVSYLWGKDNKKNKAL